MTSYDLLQREIDSLHEEIIRIGSLSEEQLASSMESIVTRNSALIKEVIANDDIINSKRNSIRDACYKVIVEYRPNEVDLRKILTTQYIAGEFERIGDYAVRIAKLARTLLELPERPLGAELPQLARLARRQLHDIIDALALKDAQLAREIAKRDDEVDAQYHAIYDELVDAMGKEKMSGIYATSLLMVSHNLERISDRVTNIAEDIVFLVSGERPELG
jgi:phosphate transport system protein